MITIHLWSTFTHMPIGHFVPLNPIMQCQASMPIRESHSTIHRINMQTARAWLHYRTQHKVHSALNPVTRQPIRLDRELTKYGPWLNAKQKATGPSTEDQRKSNSEECGENVSLNSSKVNFKSLGGVCDLEKELTREVGLSGSSDVAGSDCVNGPDEQAFGCGADTLLDWSVCLLSLTSELVRLPFPLVSSKR